jgi:hypothetical protein
MADRNMPRMRGGAVLVAVTVVCQLPLFRQYIFACFLFCHGGHTIKGVILNSTRWHMLAKEAIARKMKGCVT